MPRVHCRCPAGAQTRCCSRTEQTMGNNPANADRRDCADISGTYLGLRIGRTDDAHAPASYFRTQNHAGHLHHHRCLV